MNTKSVDLNLDDENEVEDFLATYGTLKGRALANRLEITGAGCVRRANNLSGYAWNKHTAIACRKRGEIEDALRYEAICERIYGRMDRRDQW